MQRLAPWQRIMVAMARGLLLKPSGQMKWTAHVEVFGVTPQESQMFDLIGFDADSESDAAQVAAEASAIRVYGIEGTRSKVDVTHSPLYIASIGYYDGKGVTRGRSIEMLILRYRHPVTGK